MNKNISIALTSASISALAFVAGSQYIKKQDDIDISDKDLESVKSILNNQDVNTPISGEMIEFLSDNDGKIDGVQVEDILASSDIDDSSDFSRIPLFDNINNNKGGNKVDCHSNCHGNCHSNCHGSRSWR